MPILQGGFSDPWVAFGPVVTTASNQSHAVAVPLHQQAEAIVLDLVVPLRAGWNLGASDGDAELKRFKHVPKIGAAQKNCEIVMNINDDFPRQW